MSNTIQPRPVSLFTIVFLFVLFAAGIFVANHFYAPAPLAAQNAAPENLTKELEWRATAQSRRAALAELNEAQRKKEAGYSWADQKAGAVQLPIDRAIELTAEKYGAKK